MKITRRLLIPTLSFTALVILVLLSIQTWLEARRLTQTEQDALTTLQAIFDGRLQAEEDFAVALALEAANNPDIQAAFAARDRETLTSLTLPAYEQLDARFGISQYQYHLPPATSFLRLHQLDRFGDDLSSFRQTVMQANANQEIVSGLEVGRGGMGVRGVVPVFFQGEHIGTVEIGANVDQILLDALKEDYNADWQIFLRRDLAELAVEGFVGTTPGPIPELAFQSGTLAAPLFGPTEAYSQALTGESAYTRRVLQEDANYGLLTIPLQDFSGQVVGVVDVLVDRSALAQAQLTRGLVFLASAVGALAITGFGLAWIIGRILSPVGRLTETAEAIAAGDRSRLVSVESNDELGTLAEAFNKMTNELNSLIDTLEDRVTARTHDLALSGEVSRSLSTILDVNQLAGQVVQQVQAAFNFYHVHIYLLDETQQKLVMVNGTGEAGQAMLARGHSLMVGQGLVGQATGTKTAVLVPDVHQDSQWLPNPLLPETQAEVAVPILLGEQVLGVLDVQHNIVNGLNAENARLLQTIADQVAIALQNARQVEQTRQSQERFALVITGTNDGIWDWDIRTNQVYFSPRWKEMIGYADHEISDDFAEFENRLHPEDHDFVMKQVDAYLHGRLPTYEFEFRLQHKDGSYRWILVRASLERDSQGQPLRMAGSHTDVTERKEGEERIRRSEERFALAAAGTNDGVWDWDIRTNQVYFSPRWKEMIGYADDEISNDFAEFENRLHPDDHDFVMKQVDDYLNGRISTYEFEFRLQHKDGSYRWILVRAALVRDEHGAPLRMAGSHTDITARKEAEEAIRNEQERTQAILESLNLPIVISRMTDGTVVYLNEPLADMIRQSRETLMGQVTPNFYHNPAERQQYLTALREHGSVSSFEVQLKRSDGEPFWALLSGRVLDFEDNPAVVTSVIDVTARRQAQDALALRARELQTVALVGTAAATILEPEQLLQEVVDLTKNQFGLYHAHMYLLNEASDTLVLHTGAGEIGRQLVAQGRQIYLYQEQSLVARAARTRLGVVVNDVQTEPDFLPNPLLPETRAEMAVPLIAGSQVLGVLDVQSATVGRFTEEEVSIFTTLASQVAVALQNARRYNEAQRALDELQRIQRVLVREGWQAFLLAKERPLQGFYYDQQTARPIVQSQAEDPADVTAVTTALTVRGQTIGKIGVRNPSGAPLNDNQRLLLATLTAQVSEALERARLSEQTQLALTESETLAQLSARLNAAQTYQDITRAITSLINARIHKPAVAVLFEIDVNAQGQPEWMNLMATEDTGDATDAFQRFPVNLFTAEPLWVHNSSRPTFIADAQNDPRLAPTEKEIYKLNGTVSIVYLPLRLAGRWIGLFSLAWTEPITFTTTDERLLTAVLNQLALSMNSIQLLKIAEKRARQEQLLREVSARVSATVDAESVLKTAVREIGRALGLETFIYLKNQNVGSNGLPATETAVPASAPHAELEAVAGDHE